jgi:glutathione peroxidase
MISVKHTLTGILGLGGLLVSLVYPPVVTPGETAVQICGENSDFRHHLLDSDQQESLCERFRDKVVLVVNTASRCAFTDQYDALERLYAKYREQGLLVVGFPSNDFGNQEPGSEKAIKDFCRMTYGVAFPMYGKTRVRGDQADPFYQALAQAAGERPHWNFHKYLLDRQGRLIGSYNSFTPPLGGTLRKAIEHAL